MAVDSLKKASTHKKGLERAPGKSDNWIERSGPGGKGGQLPAYIQHIALAVEKKGKDRSQAIAIAIGTVKRWAAGGGNVDANTRAAAQKALAEWEKLKASAAGKRALKESPIDEEDEVSDEDVALVDAMEWTDLVESPESPLAIEVSLGDLSLLEASAGQSLSGRSTTAATPGARKSAPAPKLIPKPKAKKSRSGGSQDFEKQHPRGRGGSWTIKQGSSGDDVRTVQRKIGAKADGNFGAKTHQQVMDFQKKHGLQVDGIVGHQTATALAGHYDAARSAKVGGLKGSDRAKLNLAGHSPAAPASTATKPPKVKTNTQAGNPRKNEKYVATTNAKGQKVHRYRTPDGKSRDVVLRESALGITVPVGESVLAMRVGDDGRLVESDDGAIHEEADLLLVETVDGHGTMLTLVESAVPAEAMFNADGTIDFVIIRPSNGRGMGSRIYEADMLRENASVWAGVNVFDNHDSPEAKRARRGIPRPPSELAGEIRESFWDPDFTTPKDAEMGFGRGAVIGRFMLTEDMERLVRRLPRAVKTSINAQATGMRPGTRNGKRGMLVEGILHDPENMSVDLVTKAGAGGQVAALYREMATAA